VQKIIAVSLGVCMTCALSGCILVPIALVGGGVIGGMAISEDTVQTEFDRSYAQVWDASLAVLDKAGAIEIKDKELGIIQGYVRKSKVTVRLEELTASTVRIQVKARKSAGVLPDIKTSHTIAYRVSKSLRISSGPGGQAEPSDS